MTSTTVRTDMIRDSEGRHQKVVTTTTIFRADEKDETVSPTLHDTVEVIAAEPAPQVSIDQSKPCTQPGKPATDNVSNWIDDSDSAASKWPKEMR